MNKKLFALIASIALIAIGCVVSYFAKFEPLQISGFAYGYRTDKNFHWSYLCCNRIHCWSCSDVHRQ